MHSYTAVDLVLIITTIFTGIVSVIGAFKGSSNGKKLDVASDKVDAVRERALQQDVKLDSIHKVANGNLEKALAKVNELLEENQRLKEDNMKFNLRQRLP